MAPEVAQLAEHRAALTGHCYRMLGSAADADDAVQEAMVRAWRALDRFDGRSSMRTWLYKIATNVCLDAARNRRARPIEERAVCTVDDVLETRPSTHWLEPIADERAIPADADPSEKVLLRESIRLAFVAALQNLPPKQRAALLLTEVLGWSAAEVADSLDTSLAAVNSALQRARATLATRPPPPSVNDAHAALLERYVSAFERYDMDALSALLHQDATLCMPPFTMWLQGHDSIRDWMLGKGAGCRGSRLVPTWANGQPAFGQYRAAESGGHQAWALIVLDLSGEQISGVTSFLDTETLFPHFGLPLKFPG